MSSFSLLFLCIRIQHDTHSIKIAMGISDRGTRLIRSMNLARLNHKLIWTNSFISILFSDNAKRGFILFLHLYIYALLFILRIFLVHRAFFSYGWIALIAITCMQIANIMKKKLILTDVPCNFPIHIHFIELIEYLHPYGNIKCSFSTSMHTNNQDGITDSDRMTRYCV